MVQLACPDGSPPAGIFPHESISLRDAPRLPRPSPLRLPLLAGDGVVSLLPCLEEAPPPADQGCLLGPPTCRGPQGLPSAGGRLPPTLPGVRLAALVLVSVLAGQKWG